MNGTRDPRFTQVAEHSGIPSPGTPAVHFYAFLFSAPEPWRNEEENKNVKNSS